MVLNGFDDDDGVVNHESNGEHKAEERKGVNRKTKRGKDDERADEGDWNRQQRDQCGAPALEKDEDNDHDKPERFKKRVHDLANADGDSLRGVERDAVRDAWRKGRGKLLDASSNSGSSLYRIGARQLIDGHDAGGRLVVAAGESIGLIAQFDSRDVFQVKNRAIGIGPEDDVAKLLRLDQSALGTNRVGELLSLRNRLSANLAGGVDVVLGLDG